MPESHPICPRCQGYGRIGNSPSDPNARLCDLCGGGGRLMHGQVPPPEQSSGPFAPGEAWALTKVGARNTSTAIVVLVAAVLVVAPVVIVISWWSAASDQIRPVLELLPESLVTTTADGSGQPWVVAAIVLAITAAGVGALSIARRRAIADLEGSSVAPYLWGLARAIALVGGLGLAAVAGPMADGADLRDEPTVFSETWHVAVVVVLVTLYAVLGTRRLIGADAARRHAAARVDDVGSDASPPPPDPGNWRA